VRTAERAKIWTTVRDFPKREVQLTSFSFSGIPGLLDGEVVFTSPITAICGINGTGKSSLLRGLWASLRWSDVDKAPEIRERLQNLQATLEMTVRGTSASWQLPENAAANNPAIDLLHIDPSTVAAQLQKDVCAINQIEDVLEPHDPITLHERDLRLLSFVLNKQYEAALIYEIDDYPNLDPFPVVVVNEHGVTYDVRTMSLGEISVFTIFWALHRAEKNSIILLEEPETFLSPVSQGAFFDYLAHLCVQKQLSLVLTTHSPQMFARLSKEQIKFIYRTPGGAKLAPVQQFEAMRRAVGIKSEVDLILVVEDRAAREFTSNILRKFDHSLLLRSEVIDVNGLGDVSRVCQTFPTRAKSFEVIGVYDGDSREELRKINIIWKAMILPCDLSVEESFIEMVDAEPATLAQLLNQDRERLEVILAQIRGRDHHDWYEDLSKELRINYEQLMHGCFEQWCSDIRNEADAENFLFDLRKLARPQN
jgi:predicted ATPase